MKESSEKSVILGWVFLGWFVLSIIAMMYFASVNTYIAVMLFGQLFFIFGLIPLTSKESRSLIGIPFVLVGIACMVIPFLMLNPGLIKIKLDWDIVIPALLCSVFIIVGICMLVLPEYFYKKKRKVCTDEIEAEVYALNSHINQDSVVYAPAYKYNYNGVDYVYASSNYSNINVPSQGDIRKIYINPLNPEEAVESKNGSNILLMIMGVIFVLAGAFAEYCIFMVQ